MTPPPVRSTAAVKRVLGLLLPRRRFALAGPCDSPMVCLTFDDGPDEPQTSRLLDALARHEVPATFFVLGRQAARHPELVQRIVAEGHEVGHHSYSHPSPEQISAAELVRECRETSELIAGITGRRPWVFRPPFGALSPLKLWRLLRAGERVVLWSYDPRDFEAESAEMLWARLSSDDVRGGDILLFHDTHPHAADVMGALACRVREAGLRFATVSEMLGLEAGTSGGQLA